MRECFQNTDFALFNIEDLNERMEAIRENIQPIFKHYGDLFMEEVNTFTEFKGSFHIAQHRRRTTNPPDTTWSAIGGDNRGDNRGYKKYPHIQIGINQKYIYMFLSIIDNPKHEVAMARYLLDHPSLWGNISQDYYVSGDHTKTDILKADKNVMIETLNRLIKIKKGEFMFGRIIPFDSDMLKSCKKQEEFLQSTLNTLLPIYKELLDLYQMEESK